METSIELFLYLVAMARILVVFLRIYRKSRRKRQAKACVIDRGNPLFTELWRKPQTNGFQEFIYFVTARSFTADGGPL